MSFEKLVGELAQASEDQGILAKSVADCDADDAKIAAAADAGAAAGTKAGDGAEGSPADEGELDADGKPKAKPVMAKSFQVTLEDGSVVEAQDGAEMIKALTARIDASDASVTKALTSAVALIKSQGEMLKSFNDKLTAQAVLIKSIGNEGKGRKAVVSITDKNDGTQAAPEPKGLTGEEFMAKAMDLQKAGKLMAKDISAIETYIGRGAAVPEALIKRVHALEQK